MTAKVPKGSAVLVLATGSSDAVSDHCTSSASSLALVSRQITPLGKRSPRLLSRLDASDGTVGAWMRSNEGKKCLKKECNDLRT